MISPFYVLWTVVFCIGPGAKADNNSILFFFLSPMDFLLPFFVPSFEYFQRHETPSGRSSGFSFSNRPLECSSICHLVHIFCFVKVSIRLFPWIRHKLVCGWSVRATSTLQMISMHFVIIFYRKLKFDLNGGKMANTFSVESSLFCRFCTPKHTTAHSIRYNNIDPTAFYFVLSKLLIVGNLCYDFVCRINFIRFFSFLRFCNVLIYFQFFQCYFKFNWYFCFVLFLFTV